MINRVLMVQESGNFICILSYSRDHFPPASRLYVWVVFIYHLSIPQKVPFEGGNPGETVFQATFQPSSVYHLIRRV